MKLSYLFLLLISFCICTRVIAQKDAPVLGDAAKLIDLLKKDYNTVDPEGREEEIIRDRALVIATMKSYSDTSITTALSSTAVKDVKDALSNLMTLKQKKATLISMSLTVSPAEKELLNTLQKIDSNLAQTQETYYEKKYVVDNTELENIEKSYRSRGNLYISYVTGLFKKKYEAIRSSQPDPYAVTNYNAAVLKSIPLLGGDLSFEVLMDGLSRFLAKRIKQELTTSVIKQVQKQLSSPPDNSPLIELKVLMPRTTQYLMTFQADQVTNFTNEIKQYIEDDFNHVLEHIGGLQETPRFKKLILKHPDVGFAFEAADIIPKLSKAKHPLDFLDLVCGSKNLNRWAKDPQSKTMNVANLFYLANMLGHSLVVVDNGLPRIAGGNFVSGYASEHNFYLLYIGFLYQQNIKYYDIQFRSSSDIRIPASAALKNLMIRFGPEDLENAREGKEFFENILLNASKSAEKVYTSALEIKWASKSGLRVGADTLHAFIENVINLTEELLYACDTVMGYLYTQGASSIGLPNLKRYAQPYFTLARGTSDIFYDLQKKKYATALLKGLELVATITPDSSAETLQEAGLILGKVDRLRQFSSNNMLKAWQIVIDSILNVPSGGTIPVTSPRMIKAFEDVLSELRKIKGESDSPDVDALSKYLLTVLNDGYIRSTQSKYQDARDLLVRRGLARVLISYYAHISIEGLLLDIDSIKYLPNVSNDNLRNAKIDITNEVYSYINYSYDFHFLHGSREDWQKSKKALDRIARYYLSGIIQKSGLADNPGVVKLIHFLNDMALAENAEDVEKAIDAFALPVGSYSIKRKAISNLSLNSYPGILLGWEHKYNSITPGKENSFCVGFTAPVGISWTWGRPKGNSLGIFIPVIDIGALTRLRLDNRDDTQALPKMDFRNVLAPGLYFHYGFANTPLSLHAGVQYGPMLRKIDDSSEPVIEEPLFFGVGAVLDIPLLNFYTKPRLGKL